MDDDGTGVLEVAMAAFNRKEFVPSLSHFLLYLSCHPEEWERIKDYFLISLDYTSRKLETANEFEALFSCFEVTLNYVQSYEIFLRLGVILLKYSYSENASEQFKKTLELNPQCICAEAGLDVAYNSLVDRWHFPMLNDEVRNGKYKNAIIRIVQNLKTSEDGPSVLDIGSGTAILSMVAADVGASKVYACEMSEFMCKISANVIKNCSEAQKIHLINRHSSQIEIPADLDSRVNIIVTETFDAGLLGEHILVNLQHAQKNLLKKSGKILPQKADIWCCLVQCKKLRTHQRMVRKNGSHITCLDKLNVCLIAEPLQEPYTSEDMSRIRGGYKELCEPFKLINIDFNDPKQVERLISGEEIDWKIHCKTSGVVDAAILWFDLHVDERNCISTAPKRGTCWEQAVFPVIHAQDDKRNELKVLQESVVTGIFMCKEHLTLQKIEVVYNQSLPDKFDRGSKSTPTPDDSELIMLDYQTIQFLNSSEWVDQVYNTLSKAPMDALIIDMSDFPICGLLGLKDGANDLAIIHTKYDEQVKSIARANGIDLNLIHFYDDIFDLCFVDSRYWNVLIFDPIAHNGTLKPGLLEDVAILKKYAMVYGGLVIPHEIFTFGHAIKSDQLVRQTRIIGDENTLNYKIAKHFNEFRTRMQYEMDLLTLDHEKMTHPVCINAIDFNGPVSQINLMPAYIPRKFQHDFISIDNGEVSAIVVWFKIKINSEQCSENTMLVNNTTTRTHKYNYSRYETIRNVISTLDFCSHWNQIAFIPKNEISVEKNDNIDIVAELEKSIFYVKIGER